MDKIDIFRTATLLIKEHGDNASIEAAMRHDNMLEHGDMDGASMWKRVLGAIDELQRTKPNDREKIH